MTHNWSVHHWWEKWTDRRAGWRMRRGANKGGHEYIHDIVWNMFPFLSINIENITTSRIGIKPLSIFFHTTHHLISVLFRCPYISNPLAINSPDPWHAASPASVYWSVKIGNASHVTMWFNCLDGKFKTVKTVNGGRLLHVPANNHGKSKPWYQQEQLAKFKRQI